MHRRTVLGGLTAAIVVAVSAFAATGQVTGDQQSPVRIVNEIPAEIGPITIVYKAGRYKVYNDGYTIKVLAPAGSTLTVGGLAYDLEEFHFHIPAEHVVGTLRSAMELHFVNKRTDGTAAALGVFLDSGAANQTFHDIIAVAPRVIGKEHANEITLDPNLLLPDDRHYWMYMGSLTTPPHSQVVRWLVLRTHKTIALGDITRFKTYYTDNAYPVQEINRRFILSGP